MIGLLLFLGSYLYCICTCPAAGPSRPFSLDLYHVQWQNCRMKHTAQNKTAPTVSPCADGWLQQRRSDILPRARPLKHPRLAEAGSVTLTERRMRTNRASECLLKRQRNATSTELCEKDGRRKSNTHLPESCSSMRGRRIQRSNLRMWS